MFLKSYNAGGCPTYQILHENLFSPMHCKEHGRPAAPERKSCQSSCHQWPEGSKKKSRAAIMVMRCWVNCEIHLDHWPSFTYDVRSFWSRCWVRYHQTGNHFGRIPAKDFQLHLRIQVLQLIILLRYVKITWRFKSGYPKLGGQTDAIFGIPHVTRLFVKSSRCSSRQVTDSEQPNLGHIFPLSKSMHQCTVYLPAVVFMCTCWLKYIYIY